MDAIIIFDIDGTLTNTRAIDEASYNWALKEVFNIEIPPAQRQIFNSSSDFGLIKEIFSVIKEKSITALELQKFQSAFTDCLEKMLQKQYSENLLIKGADKLIRTLKEQDDIIFSFATGAWSSSAQLKLQYANIDWQGVSLTTADEGVYKEDILKIAFSKINKIVDVSTRAFYVGDRHWDYLAAKKLEMEFIGVGTDVQMLEHAQGEKILADFSNIDYFLELVKNE